MLIIFRKKIDSTQQKKIKELIKDKWEIKGYEKHRSGIINWEITILEKIKGEIYE